MAVPHLFSINHLQYSLLKGRVGNACYISEIWSIRQACFQYQISWHGFASQMWRPVCSAVCSLHLDKRSVWIDHSSWNGDFRAHWLVLAVRWVVPRRPKRRSDLGANFLVLIMLHTPLLWRINNYHPRRSSALFGWRMGAEYITGTSAGLHLSGIGGSP